MNWRISARQARWGLIGCFSLSVFAAGVALFSASTTRVRVLTPNRENASLKELGRFLEEVDRTWHPQERERLLTRAESRIPRLAPAFELVLRDVRHTRLTTALELVVHYGIEQARDDALALVGDGSNSVTRGFALRTAHALAPLPLEVLVQYLDAEDDLQLAAIELCAVDPAAPWDRLCELLVAAPPQRQGEITEVLPVDLPQPAIDAMLTACLDDPTSAISFVRVVSRGEPTERTAPILIRCLSNDDPEMVSLALAALARKSSPLEDSEPVWAIVQADGPDWLRAEAMQCLAAVGAIDLEQLGDLAWTLPPRTRYHAARLMLERGASEAGIRCLLGLAQLEVEQAIDEKGLLLPEDGGAAQSVRVASHRLLARLAGLTPGASLDEIEAWTQTLQSDWAPAKLPAAPSF